MPAATPTDLTALDTAVESALDRAIAELTTLVAIPSVAAQMERGAPMTVCAEAVAEILRGHGLEARLAPTDGGPPVVFAEDRRAGVDAPTVLFYNHYDVQPAEPFDLWESDPWTLRIDGDLAIARGVSDDKGHIVCRLMALDALRAQNDGALPVNVKWVIEGEEEVSSIHLPAWVEANAAILDADVCIWEFGGVDEGGHPEIVCGLRGIACFELHARTIAYDAHSGVGGSLLPNAAWRLVQALNTLKDKDDRILIPGHYDAVHPASPDDLALLAKLPNTARTEAYLKREFGIETFLGGATGVEYERRQVFEPTITINGLASGYQGEGSKTILPAHAMAKLDCRLVPDQDPVVLRDALRAHLDAGGFTDVEVVYLGGQRPARVDPNHPMVQLALETARDVYDESPSLYPMVGVSGPFYPFAVTLKEPIVTIGCGYPGARVHAPNENLRLSDLTRGAKHTARFLAALAAQ
jgi:acetylornithine deacetylase/succinyl-diaminopimelate desuccinylase-like protein